MILGTMSLGYFFRIVYSSRRYGSHQFVCKEVLPFSAIFQEGLPGTAMKSFYDRLMFILGRRAEEREKHPWGKALGITQSTIGRMTKEQHVPNAEILTRIARAENASLNWLLSGTGAPFLVVCARSDTEARDLLQQHLTEESGWAIHILTGEAAQAIVLTQPCRMQTDDVEIDYTCVVILSGAGAKTINAAFAARTRHSVRVLRLTQDQMQRVSTGWMGNLELIGWRHHTGLLADAVPVQDTDIEFTHVAEPSTRYGLAKDERELLDFYRELTDDKQQALLRLLRK